MFAKESNKYWWENPNNSNHTVKIPKPKKYNYNAWGEEEQARIRRGIIPKK